MKSLKPHLLVHGTTRQGWGQGRTKGRETETYVYSQCMLKSQRIKELKELMNGFGEVHCHQWDESTVNITAVSLLWWSPAGIYQ